MANIALAPFRFAQKMRDEQVLDDQPEDLGLSEGGKIHWLIINIPNSTAI